MSERKRYIIKTTDIVDRTYKNPEWKKKIADAARENWKNPEYVARWKSSMKASHPDYVFSDDPEAIAESAAKAKRKRKDYINRLICSCRRERAAKERLLAAKKREASWRVYCFETDTIYSSANQAAIALSLEQSCISKVLRGDGKSTGGYHFKKASA
jgi:hypothetical protein